MRVGRPVARKKLKSKGSVEKGRKPKRITKSSSLSSRPTR